MPGTRIEFTDFTPERKAQEPGDFVSDITKIRRPARLGAEGADSARASRGPSISTGERRADYF